MIYFRNATRGSGVDTRALKKTVRSLLKAAGETQSTISISLVNDSQIQKLNREHCGMDRPTDVLSFPLYERDEKAGEVERLLGDIVISLDTARRQAEAYDATLQTELHRLLIHGILHLQGHDHEDARERAEMEDQERRLASAIQMPWPYD